MLAAYSIESVVRGNPSRMSPTMSMPGRSFESELIHPGRGLLPQPQFRRFTLSRGILPSGGHERALSKSGRSRVLSSVQGPRAEMADIPSMFLLVGG